MGGLVDTQIIRLLQTNVMLKGHNNMILALQTAANATILRFDTTFLLTTHFDYKVQMAGNWLCIRVFSGRHRTSRLVSRIYQRYS